MPKGPGKGNTNNPDGRPKGIKNSKTILWEQFGDKMTNEFAKAAQDHMRQLLDEGKYNDFMSHYKDFVNYFKPKLSSAQVKAEVKADVSVKPVIDFGDNANDDQL